MKINQIALLFLCFFYVTMKTIEKKYSKMNLATMKRKRTKYIKNKIQKIGLIEFGTAAHQ